MTPLTASLERQTTRVVFRSRLAAFVGPALALAGAGLLTLGTLTLFGRSGFGSELPGSFAPWVGLGMGLVALAFGISRARTRGLTRAQAATWLDLESGATGELVTADELGAGAGRWRGRADTRAQGVRCKYPVEWQKPLALVACAALFAVGTGFVPLRVGSASGRLKDLFEERIEELRDQLAALDEGLDLEEEEKAAIEDALDRLEEDAESDPDLESTYEAIDRLGEQLAERADESLDAARRSLDALAEAAEAAAGSENSAEGMEQAADALAAAMAALDEFDLEGLQGARSNFDAADLAALAEQVASGEFDPAKAAEISAAMREALEKALANLGDAGLFDGAGMKALGELPELTAEHLAMLEAAAELAADVAAAEP